MKRNYLKLLLAVITVGMVTFLSFWQLNHQVFASTLDSESSLIRMKANYKEPEMTPQLTNINSFTSNPILVIDFQNEKNNEGKLVFGGSYILRSGEVLEGDLVIMGGEAYLQEDSLVDGAVVIFGGVLQADGEIKGELVSFGGQIDLGETAIVESDVVSFGGNLNYTESTEFGGELISEFPGPIDFNFSEDFNISSISPSRFWQSFNPVIEIMWLFLRSFIWAAVAVLVMLFLDKQVERISATVSAQPVISGGLGLLTVVVAPVLLLGLIVTIIGIPLSMVLVFILGLAWALGIVSVGYLVGIRIARMLNQTWVKPVNAGAGVFTLTFVINGIGLFVPCVGWFIPALVGMVGLGAVGLTRFGTQSYPVADNSGGDADFSANAQYENSKSTGTTDTDE
jgi:hypothetical protein